MDRKITEKQQKELDYMKEWCLTILNFMISRNSNTPIITQTKNVILETYNSHNIKGLRYCNKDITEWAKGLNQSDFVELNKFLHDKFGEDLVKNDNRDLSKINQVIKKRKISCEDEYRLLLSRVDEIYNDLNKQDEVFTLNKLLADFHKK
jgi:hypothetical protein